MTGLEVGKDKIIEVAAIITDQDLKPLETEGFEQVIHQPESLMSGMDEWCIHHHGKVTLALCMLI
jgi:oligoribonuclease